MKKAAIIIGFAVLLYSSVYAADISEVYISDVDKSTLTINGTVEDNDKDISVVVVKKGEVISEGIFDYNSVSVQKAIINEDKFSTSFKFTPVEGIYSIIVPNGETRDFEYINKDSVMSIVSDLAGKRIHEQDIYGLLVRYGTSMGIDVSYAHQDNEKDYIASNFIKYADLINSEGLKGCQHIAKKSKNEIEFFAELEKTIIQANVNDLLYKYSIALEIDLSTYDSLDDSAKITVLGKFVGEKYNDIDEFKNDFYDCVRNQQLSSGTPNGSSSGGSTASSGSMTGATEKTGNIVMNFPLIQNKDNKNKLTDYFSDIQNYSWAWEAISYLNEKGIMTGMGNKVFGADKNVTREQIAKIVTVAFGYYDKEATCDFTDVPEADWSNAYVASAYRSGLMNGYDKDTFGWGQPVTRQDLCVILYRVALKKGLSFEKDGQSFLDDLEISEYAKEAIQKLSGSGVVSGMGDGMFSPKSKANRAQAANIIYAIISKTFN